MLCEFYTLRKVTFECFILLFVISHIVAVRTNNMLIGKWRVSRPPFGIPTTFVSGKISTGS